MNRTLLAVTGAFSASSLLLIDSAIKGTALLVLASIAALTLRRDSAATRYLVWLLAMVAMLVVLLLSAVLPGWRVLPRWTGIPPKPMVAVVSPLFFIGPAGVSATMPQPAAAPVAPTVVPPLAAESWSWHDALPLVWAIGFCVVSTAILTWPMDKAGGTAQHRIVLGIHAWGTRAPWLLAWERGATVLWIMSGERQSTQNFRNGTLTPSTLTQIEFSNPNKITCLTSSPHVLDLQHL